MSEVWKYQLPLTNGVHQKLAIPAQFARLLTVQLQNGVPCLWVMVEPTEPKCIWHFHWVGTGHEVPPVITCADSDAYVGTIQDGGFVFHLFQSGYEQPAD